MCYNYQINVYLIIGDKSVPVSKSVELVVASMVMAVLELVTSSQSHPFCSLSDLCTELMPSALMICGEIIM